MDSRDKSMDEIRPVPDMLNGASEIQKNLKEGGAQGSREGEGCRGLRQQHDISVEALSERSGVPERRILFYESEGQLLDTERSAIGNAMMQLIRERAAGFASLLACSGNSLLN